MLLFRALKLRAEGSILGQMQLEILGSVTKIFCLSWSPPVAILY